MANKVTTICHIIIGNQAITATNDGKTAPMFKRHHEDGSVSHCGHAETRAIQKCGMNRDLSSAKVYVMRVMANGDVSMARPCDACSAFMWRRGIRARNVRFTNWEGQWERMRA